MSRLLVCLLLTACAFAQQSPLDQANDAYAKQDYARAATLFQQAAATDASSGAAWQGLGLSSLKLARCDASEKPFGRAVELKWRPYLNRLNLARVAAKQRNNEKAFQILDELVASGKASQLLPYLAVLRLDSSDPGISAREARVNALHCP